MFFYLLTYFFYLPIYSSCILYKIDNKYILLIKLFGDNNKKIDTGIYGKKWTL